MPSFSFLPFFPPLSRVSSGASQRLYIDVYVFARILSLPFPLPFFFFPLPPLGKKEKPETQLFKNRSLFFSPFFFFPRSRALEMQRKKGPEMILYSLSNPAPV